MPRHGTARLTAGAAAVGLALGAAFFAPAAAETRPDYSDLKVGQTLPGGYVITQRYGPGGFLARRDGKLFFVRGDSVTRLDPRYPIGAQLEDVDKRTRRTSND